MLAALVARLRGRTRELPVREAYALWADTYPPEAHTFLMTLEEPALVGLLPDIAGRQTLDVGCGSGRYLKLLRAQGAAFAAGVDLTPAMLARARTLSPHLAQADASALPFAAERFDLVVAGLVVGHCPDLGRVMAEAARVLRPGGHVVYSDVHPAGTLAGWERSFRDGRGRPHAVRQHLYLYEDHQRACRAAGLAIEELREPRVTGIGRWDDWPAVLVVRARKLA